MIKKLMIAAAIAASVGSSVAQGVDFQAPLPWKEVLAKAKREHKNVFVDCFASWCGPCKLMDREVYPTAEAGKAINDKYLAVRMQMDLAGNEDADYISKTYHLEGYPTLLYLSADGTLLAKRTGAIFGKDFVQFAADALDPAKQFGNLYERYKNGSLPVKDFKDLADKADQQSRRDLALEVRKAYMRRYFNTVADTAVSSPDNLLFLDRHPELIAIGDRYFRLLTNQRAAFDKVYPGAAENIVKSVAVRERILARLGTDNPDWVAIETGFRQAYEGADTAVVFLQIKIDFYSRRKDLPAFAAAVDELLQRCPDYLASGQHVVDLNNYAWYGIFLNTSERPLLERALAWSDAAVSHSTSDDNKDTKANILYKLGRKDEAIALEQSIAKEGSDYAKTLDKMKQGLPTW